MHLISRSICILSDSIQSLLAILISTMINDPSKMSTTSSWSAQKKTHHARTRQKCNMLLLCAFTRSGLYGDFEFQVLFPSPFYAITHWCLPWWRFVRCYMVLQQISEFNVILLYSSLSLVYARCFASASAMTLKRTLQSI